MEDKYISKIIQNECVLHLQDVEDVKNEVGEVYESLDQKVDKNDGVILFEDDGIYQIKDRHVYPVSHPDLSTQPSILPQRYGNLDIKEVLIAHGREYEIPSDAMVILAFSFNSNVCVPAVCERSTVTGKWTISNPKNIIPDFTLIQYVSSNHNAPYYGYTEPYHEHVEPSVNYKIIEVPAGQTTIPGANTRNLWGTDGSELHEGQIVGEIEYQEDTYDLVVTNLGSQISVHGGEVDVLLDRSTDAGELTTALNYPITLKFIV